MSRSRPSMDIQNPISKYIRFSGERGEFSYWDKEKKEEISLGKKIRFLPLDELVSITGYSDKYKSGFWSNVVRKTAKEPLTVQASVNGDKTTIISGLYAEIKDTLKAKGAKYTKNVYATLDLEEIVCIQLSGAALSEWMDFSKNHKIYQGAVSVSKTEARKKGGVDYVVPIFKQIEAKKESNEKATELDDKLQTYFDEYFASSDEKNTAPSAATKENPVEETKEEVDELPF